MATIITIERSFSTSKRAIQTVAQFDISVAREKFWVAPFVAWGVAEKGGMAWDRHCGPARPLPSLHLMASVAQEADLGMAARLLWLLLGKEAIVQAATVGLAPRNPSPFWVRGQTIWISKDRRRRTHSRTMPYPNRIPPSKLNDSRKNENPKNIISHQKILSLSIVRELFEKQFLTPFLNRYFSTFLLSFATMSICSTFFFFRWISKDKSIRGCSVIYKAWQ